MGQGRIERRISPIRGDDRHLRRRKGRVEPHRPVLIVSEGMTERIYFTSLARAQRIYHSVICKVSEEGSHPASVVAYAAKLAAEARKDKQDYRRVWCVFDCDRHEGLERAFARARGARVDVAFSNPCFEIWFLQHLRSEYSFAHIERRNAQSETKQHLPGYSKTTCVYDAIVGSQQLAFERAERLRQEHESAGNGERGNPYTSVDRLVRYLLGLAQELNAT